MFIYSTKHTFKIEGNSHSLVKDINLFIKKNFIIFNCFIFQFQQTLLQTIFL